MSFDRILETFIHQLNESTSLEQETKGFLQPQS